MMAGSPPPAGSNRSAGEGWLRGVASVPDPWQTGQSLRLRRSWPRTAGHVLLEYGSASSPQRVVVGQWFADDRRLLRVAAAMNAAAGPDAAALLPSHGVVLHRHGADRRLAALPRLLAAQSATLVVHRPERRAVVRLDSDILSGVPRRWAKVIRPERLAALRTRTAHLTALGSSPHLLEVRPEQGVTVWADLPGVALGDVLTGDDAPAAMASTGVLLSRLHALPPPSDPALFHCASAERAVLETWLAHLMTFDPTTHRRAATLRAGVARLLGDVSPAAVRHATVHRDVHDGQILVAASGVSLLDPDTVGAGEPELDLGNLCAHLRLAAWQGRTTRDDADRLFDAVLEGYGRDHVGLQRLRAYTAAALLRLVGVHAMRPATRAALPALLTEARRALIGNDVLLAR